MQNKIRFEPGVIDASLGEWNKPVLLENKLVKGRTTFSTAANFN
jgi:hypothetical protein